MHQFSKLRLSQKPSWVSNRFVSALFGCIGVVAKFSRFLKKNIDFFQTMLIQSLFRNYSPEVINIQRHEAELNIILLKANNFDITQKMRRIFVLLYATNIKG